MSALIPVLVFVGPLYLLYFGFLGGFGAAIAEGGREDHSIWQNALVGAIASTSLGLLVPTWRLEESAFAGPLPTLVGAVLLWAVIRRLESGASSSRIVGV